MCTCSHDDFNVFIDQLIEGIEYIEYTPISEDGITIIPSILDNTCPIDYDFEVSHSQALKRTIENIYSGIRLYPELVDCVYVYRLFKSVLKCGTLYFDRNAHLYKNIVFQFLWLIASIQLKTPPSDSIHYKAKEFRELRILYNNLLIKDKPTFGVYICQSGIKFLDTITNKKLNSEDYIYTYKILAIQIFFLLWYTELKKHDKWKDLRIMFQQIFNTTTN